MTQVGQIPVTGSWGTWWARPLTVRQLVSMQRLLGQRRAAQVIEDGKVAGLPAEELMRRAEQAREQAALVSYLIRWCFELEGASEIVRVGLEGHDGAVEFLYAESSPDALTELALQLIGFQWDEQQSKWVSRSRTGASGAATG